MIQYILECLAFQLVFLLIYDLVLKQETFFQWNRAYLIGSYLVSLFLPWIKIEALKTEVPETVYTAFMWEMAPINVSPKTADSAFSITWEQGLYLTGATIALLYFVYKIVQLFQLRKKGTVQHFSEFTQVVIANSEIAFSFFKSIFLGDRVLERDYKNILEHELVHIKQKHTWDLLFFEIMRILCWFNPLVYSYQRKITELHEFIADSTVAKTDKKKQYEFLLSQVFQTQNISFINQFFKSSLIKKRIVMLQKSKSKKIFKLKYLALLPVVLGMLFYVSCEVESKDNLEKQNLKVATDIDVPYAVIDEVPIFPGCENAEDPRACFQQSIQKHISKNFRYPQEAQEKGIQGRVSVMFTIGADSSITNVRMRGPHKLLEDEAARIISKLPKIIPGKQKGHNVNVPFSIPIVFKLQSTDTEFSTKTDDVSVSKNGELTVAFSAVTDAPVFPGCENAQDTKDCFLQGMQRHIGKNFRYPEEAREKGTQGRVAILFVIAKDGSIQNVKLRGPSKSLEDEAARIINRLPIMKPGKFGGKVVNVAYSIPINFKLQ